MKTLLEVFYPQNESTMKYAIMVLRENGSYDFYSSLEYLHERENIDISLRWFQIRLKEDGIFDRNGLKVFRKEIVREG